MQALQTNGNNYTFYDYKFSKTTVRYVVMSDTKAVFMLLLPCGMEDKVNDTFKKVIVTDGGYPNHLDWYAGSLVHLHLAHHTTPMPDATFKLSETTKSLKFDRQETGAGDGCQWIKTYVFADEGYGVCHTLAHYGDENGFEVSCEFINNTGKTVLLEMITSASLDNMSPFMTDDGSESLSLHTFKGGWATEGKHIARTLPEINMEKSWGGSFESEKIGVIGSKSVGRYHPYIALEDYKNNCTWGMKIKYNASWQAELSRYGTPLSLSIGLADYKFGAWRKEVKDGETFTAPTAYIAVAKGGIDEVSNDLIEMNNRDIDAYGEEDMPIIFNDWLTHWGDTSEKKLLSLADSLKNTKVKYFVVDDGWQKGSVGDWELDKTKFPNGFKAYTDEIRKRGFIPGMWMEFESIRESANRFNEKYDDCNLTKDGYVYKNALCNSVPTKFLDLRNPKAVEHLDNVLVKFMKDNGIGYLKVDYNANIGLGCDGAESLGEGLRQQMLAVRDFFIHMKEEIPELIIENCASGGARLDPMMMGVTAMSSFSDAHECFEVPIVAANMHYLISPRQSQVWCVLKDDFDNSHMKYIISAGFLGRLCWSGYIDKLSDAQMNMIYDAEAMYEKVCHIIKDGRSRIYRTDFINNRNPQGTQAVVRYSKDKSEALVVYHTFNNAKTLEIELDGVYDVVDTLYNGESAVSGTKLIINDNDRTGNVMLLKRR